MNNLITIATFTFPTDLVILKGRLESEGIECFVKDELTIQVDNFLSNALGGVKLQVRAADHKKAVEILKETGYYVEPDNQPTAWLRLNKLTARIPLLNQVRPELRFIILSTLLAVAMVIAIYFATHRDS